MLLVWETHLENQGARPLDMDKGLSGAHIWPRERAGALSAPVIVESTELEVFNEVNALRTLIHCSLK